jgi:hypothetical protein
MSSFYQPGNSSGPGIIGLPRRPQVPIGVQNPIQDQPKVPPGVTAPPETHDYFKQMQGYFESPAGKEEAWGGASPEYRQFAQTNYAEPGPIKPRTIYHANGSVENPPATDPGFRVYNHASQMPAQDQAEMHAFRSGQIAPPPQPRAYSPGDTTGGQLLGDPSKATPMIGVPARNQAPGPIGVINGQPGGIQAPFATTTQAGFASPASMRNAMIENLSKQMQAAQSSGNSEDLYDLFAQRAALDNGGFAGHAKYIQDKETHAAQLEHLTGARPGGRQLNPDGTLNEDAFRVTANAKPGADANQTEDMIQTMRIAKSIEDAKKVGAPVSFNPNDAMKFLELRYPAYRSAWATDSDGTPARSITQVYHQLKAIAPDLISDPKSDFSTALREVLRQQHGERLAAQLDPGPEPQGTQLFHYDPLTGMKDMVNQVIHGYIPWPNARYNYLRTVPARDWFNGVDKAHKLNF